MKASPMIYAAAKRSALMALGSPQPDAFAPDAVRFFNDERGFIVRLSHGDNHVQRMATWPEIEAAEHGLVKELVRAALESLARADLGT